jgi:high-affinity iron transporter
MVVWMRQPSRSMRSTLEHDISAALGQGSVLALVGMAFFAVMPEGLETAVFLLAVFQGSNSTNAGILGPALGLALALAVGYDIYGGGVHINMARFFRVTEFVLVLVAAGLIASSIHAAHNAGWLNILQGQALHLNWLILPGSVAAALVTGMLGVPPKPTVAETLRRLIYFVPVALYVLRPQRRPATSSTRPTPEPATRVAV